MEICLIFAHVGVASNQATNAAANLGRLRSVVNLLIEPENGDIKRSVFAYINKLWYQQYVEPNKYGAFINSLDPLQIFLFQTFY